MKAKPRTHTNEKHAFRTKEKTEHIELYRTGESHVERDSVTNYNQRFIIIICNHRNDVRCWGINVQLKR